MTKYLLLRDNKESGPYSFDELKEKGLKAYDLVWVDGKSAAWRYPCEVDELSSFAPAVEEQPFDRFYKDPAQQNAAINTTVQAKQVSEKESPAKVAVAISGSSIFSGEPSAVPGKRIIYVTLPAGKGPSANKENAPRETIKTPAIFQDRQVAPIDIPASVPDEGAGSTALSSAYKHTADSQGREDWKTGVEILHHPGKRRSSSKIMQPVALVLCVLVLLSAGIFIGLSINKYNLSSTQQIALKNTATNPLPAVDHRVSNPPAPVVSVDPAPLMNRQNTDTIRSAPFAKTTVTNLKKSSGSKEKSSLSGQKSSFALSSAAKDSPMMALTVSHREASHSVDQPVEKIDKDILRNNLSNLVSAGTNSYKVGTFGGITGIQLTVSNKSVYPLDLVVVEVQYIQANKKVFKTENLYFRGIGPGSALMQEAPNSSRGTKVQYKITLIHSKELGLSYSAL